MEYTTGPEGSPYGFGIQTLFNTHSSYRFGLNDTGTDTVPVVEKPWWQDEKPVKLSAQDVINQQWNDYYRSQRYNKKAKAEGSGSGDKEGGEAKKESAKSTAQVTTTNESSDASDGSSDISFFNADPEKKKKSA